MSTMSFWQKHLDTLKVIRHIQILEYLIYPKYWIRQALDWEAFNAYHNICFHAKVRKLSILFWLKKASYPIEDWRSLIWQGPCHQAWSEVHFTQAWSEMAQISHLICQGPLHKPNLRRSTSPKPNLRWSTLLKPDLTRPTQPKPGPRSSTPLKPG